LAWEVDHDAWWRTVEVNVRGVHIVTTAVVPGMVSAGAGRIINVVSHAGTARWPYSSAYVVSKAGAIKYGENLAAEVRKHGVKVFNYHPGILEIGLTEKVFETEPEPGSLEEMVFGWFKKQIADGKSVDAVVAADTLVRLALGDADFLSGRYVTAYDDLDELISRGAEIADSRLYTLGLLEPD
jgi:NAD(P)-dependent dehydrogenase (short-subunit alcohol dehydrogenase family)